MPEFYKQGLCFECQKDCSKCCGGSPGYVWLNEENIQDISEHLKISEDEFFNNYTKQVGENISLIDLEEDNWNCIMLKDGKCTIYEKRPLQCRTYPFWHQNLISKPVWEERKRLLPRYRQRSTLHSRRDRVHRRWRRNHRLRQIEKRSLLYSSYSWSYPSAQLIAYLNRLVSPQRKRAYLLTQPSHSCDIGLCVDFQTILFNTFSSQASSLFQSQNLSHPINERWHGPLQFIFCYSLIYLCSCL